MNLILRIKLWWFWNVHLKRDEFSTKLDIGYFSKKFPKLPINDRLNIMAARRILAHDLDNGSSIGSLSIFEKTIKRAKI